MAFRHGDRFQMNLFPQSLDDYVGQNDPARVYDAFVEALDYDELGISLHEKQAGNARYNPKSMLKLLLYGYSYGIRSSRKLERATYHNVSFMWMVEGLRPDHKTIARFRRDHRESFKQVMKQCARLCLKLDLIDGNTLFVDGTKIRANASINHTWKEKRCQEMLSNIDERINAIMDECDAKDKEETNAESFVELKEELADKKSLKLTIKSLLGEIKSEEKTSVNTTDKDCVVVKGRQGHHAGYNGQIVVDDKHGLIVNSDVVNESNDRNQFSNQITQAQEILDKPCETACADSGYANTNNLAVVDKDGVKVVVPTQEQESKQVEKPFSKQQFRYDAENDCYWCSKEHPLKYSTTDHKTGKRIYRINSRKICTSCCHFGQCTTAQKGRSITRLFNEDIKRKLEKQYQTLESQVVYKRRKEKAELPFGHIKRNLGVQAFLLRGIQGVRAEMSIFSTNFNLSRLITLIDTKTLLDRLKVA